MALRLSSDTVAGKGPPVMDNSNGAGGLSFSGRLSKAWLSQKGLLTLGLWSAAVGGMVVWSVQRRKKRLALNHSLLGKHTKDHKGAIPGLVHLDSVESEAKSQHLSEQQLKDTSQSSFLGLPPLDESASHPLTEMQSLSREPSLGDRLLSSRSFLNLGGISAEEESELMSKLTVERKNSLYSLLPRMYSKPSYSSGKSGDCEFGNEEEIDGKSGIASFFSRYNTEALWSTLSLPIVMYSWFVARDLVKKQNAKMASYLINKNWAVLFDATVSLALVSMPASVLSKLMSYCTARVRLAVNNNLTLYYTKEYLTYNHSYLCKLVLADSGLAQSAPLSTRSVAAMRSSAGLRAVSEEAEGGEGDAEGGGGAKAGDSYVCERITNDMEKLSEVYADLLNSMLWSVGGICMLSLSLVSKMGLKEYLTAIVYSGISRQLISTVNEYSVGYGALVESMQRSAAVYRGTHATINEYSEEIAILNGGHVEQRLLSRFFKACQRAQRDYFDVALVTEAFGNYFTAELGNVVGYLSMVPAVYAGHWLATGQSTLELNANVVGDDTIQYLTSTVQELGFLTKLFERVFRISKKLSEVNGYAHRIVELDKVLSNVVNNDDLNPKCQIETTEDYIALRNVTIETPLGQRLIRGLTLRIERGEHLFISGPNGCGKTSLFRVIAGLWSPVKGSVQAPVRGSANMGMFLLSQRPYLVPTLTFRQQLCYPESGDYFATAALSQMLTFVGMAAVVNSRGGLDSVAAATGLSGGERQRVGMARCLLHKPLFALLDECSSAVSAEMQSKFFEECLRMHITLVTVAHEWALSRFHKRCLKIDRHGAWKLLPLPETQT